MKKSLFFSVCLASIFSAAHADTVKIYAAASLTNAISDIEKFMKSNILKQML